MKWEDKEVEDIVGMFPRNLEDSVSQSAIKAINEILSLKCCKTLIHQQDNQIVTIIHFDKDTPLPQKEWYKLTQKLTRHGFEQVREATYADKTRQIEVFKSAVTNTLRLYVWVATFPLYDSNDARYTKRTKIRPTS